MSTLIQGRGPEQLSLYKYFNLNLAAALKTLPSGLCKQNGIIIMVTDRSNARKNQN